MIIEKVLKIIGLGSGFRERKVVIKSDGMNCHLKKDIGIHDPQCGHGNNQNYQKYL